MFHMDMPMDYHLWDAIWDTIEDTCQIWSTLCRTKKFVSSPIQNYLLHAFIDKAVVSFCNSFNRALLQQVGTDIVNTLFK